MSANKIPGVGCSLVEFLSEAANIWQKQISAEESTVIHIFMEALLSPVSNNSIYWNVL